jgi:TM2 domain-containing membrane protein YozV
METPRYGREVAPDATVCRTSGSDAGTARAAADQAPSSQGQKVPVPPAGTGCREPISTTLSPLFAAVLSVIPGAGQVYCGRTRRAIAFLVGTFIGTLLLLVPGIVVWLWGIVDASRIACMVNSGDAEPRVLKSENIILYGIALVVVGTALMFVLVFYLLLFIGLSTAW